METPDTKPYNLPDNAVWFVTGCSSGIGQGLAQYIATKKPSQRVVATARNPASLSDIPDGPNVLKLALDVTSVPSIDAAFDIVVNNAGYNLTGDTESSPPGNAPRPRPSRHKLPGRGRRIQARLIRVPGL
ncbi:uncharacterized protein F4817DRAFT_25944 [Daldinia loculata]|uniref:uncharacterized protein n=1 Tax=Daldinia loculata TaxID=103429 RepID=UPI0020C4E9CF|nr:uncharacterized protein F4817DRAFT_25944 [Daldinia loculata]KAI1649582.1 hypothetical protein F4817DRAFT_25944 [Daldinia loculata]